MRRLLALLFLLAAAAPAAAQRTLVIERFDVSIDVARDGGITVEERIRARFTGSWNGIFRTIPIQYRSPHGLNYTLRLNLESVTDDGGRELRHESSRERHNRKIKIWVPGAQDVARTVVLRYRVSNGLRFFDEHDELYWNLTGDEWDVPIEAASAVVRLPEGVTHVRATAFRGVYGSTERASAAVDGRVVRVDSVRPLAFREGLTVVVGWDPGVVERPTVLETAASHVYSNLPLAIPPFVFLVMWRLWHARGRDPEPGPIATRYEPPDGLTPGELGTLVDGKPDMRDITATIVDLAVRGYLHVEERKTEGFLGLFSSENYRFTLNKPREEWTSLKAHERSLLSALFADGYDEVDLSDLKNKFYKHLPGLKNSLYSMLVSRGYYIAQPDRVRTKYFVAAGVIGVLIAWAGNSLMVFLGMQPLSAFLAGILSGLIIAGFGYYMPARTVSGTRELEKVLGFQEFLSRVEGDRLARLATNPQMFEAFLPYAMALGVEENWAKAFDGIHREPPSWYTGGDPIHGFHPTSFTNSIGRMSTQAAAVMASAPRSSGGSGFSGGGSSGGGFGGGGGGGF
ncbi:MAG TPA: DUF2207 domain-containing protein [Vicinamibacterales bacterium]|nr:DUF2207 domain-containing protein [Vicinamibacterales bacterium]